MKKGIQVVLFRPNEKQESKELYFKEIIAGLTAPQKYIDFKFVYDEEGSQMLSEINASDKYYLSKSQAEMLHQESSNILKMIGKERFNLVDLGAGDGLKTQILVNRALEEKYEFEYIPLDISYDSNRVILDRYQHQLPELSLTAITSQYEQGIDWILNHKPCRNVYVFLGGTIGNMSLEENKKFVLMLSEKFRKGDLLFVGFDPFKDPSLITEAYSGHESLIMNQLKRINKELKSNFHVGDFYHHYYFQPFDRAVNSVLISKKKQSVQIRNQVINFKEAEVIKSGYSKKWLNEQIIELFSLGGFSKVGGYSHSGTNFGLLAFNKQQ